MRRATPQSPESAWERAKSYGIDVSLLAANLRRTPAERLRQHSRALATVLTLRQSMRGRHA